MERVSAAPLDGELGGAQRLADEQSAEHVALLGRVGAAERVAVAVQRQPVGHRGRLRQGCRHAFGDNASSVSQSSARGRSGSGDKGWMQTCVAPAS